MSDLSWKGLFGKDETVLWNDKPNARTKLWDRQSSSPLKGIPWIVMGIVFMVPLYLFTDHGGFAANSFREILGVLGWLFLLPAAMITFGCFQLFGRQKLAADRRKTEHYLLTNKRAVTLRRSGDASSSSIIHRSWYLVEHSVFAPPAPFDANIDFVPKSRDLAYVGGLTIPRGFENLRDRREVLKLIHEITEGTA